MKNQGFGAFAVGGLVLGAALSASGPVAGAADPGWIAGSFVGWSSVSNLPAARGYLAAASVNGKIYAIGGDSSGGCQSTVYVYDPSQPTQGWLSVSNLPAARHGLAAACVNGKIYAIGGADGSGYQSTVYVYDPSQPMQGWMSVSNLPAARGYLAAASMNGKIYAIGGYGSGGCQSTVYVYDPSQPAQGWMSVSNLPAARGYLAAASVNGKIYAIGGYNGSYQSAVYVYDPSQPAQGWMSVSNLPAARCGLAAASVNGRIHAIGGEDYWSGCQSTVYVYDPSQPAQGWLSASNLPAARGYLAAASVNGRIYAIGGDNYFYQSTAYEGSFAAGVSPSSGPLAGGNTVTISGSGLGNGDVTNVTLCGIAAVILADRSPTQVVVCAGSAGMPTHGDVAVYSVSCGMTVKSKAYSYLPPAPVALDATNMTLNSFYANWQGVVGATNYLLDVSTTSDFSSFAGGYANLSAGNPTTYKVDRLMSGTTYYYRVRCEQNGVIGENSSTIAVQTLSGAISVSNGPASGGNTLTVSGAGLGDGSDITNVTVCGIAAAIQGQSADSVSVVVGAEGSGTGEIRVYSSSRGVTVFANGYTYNPPGYIFGPFMGWSSVSNLPAARSGVAAASANGKIYAIGGYDGSSCQSTVYLYDPSQPAQGWLSVSNLPTARGYLAAASVNGKIYVIGGYNGSDQSTVYVYDPSQPTQGWLSVSNLPAGRRGLAAASVNGRIYAIGGYDGSYQSTVYVYDPSQPAQGWLSVSNLPTARGFLAAASVNGKTYAIGGYGSGGNQSTVYVYDPSRPAQGWLSVSTLPAARYDLAAASVNGKIYAIGGYSGSGFQSTVYAYDPSQPAQGWLSVSNLPAARGYLAAASVNGKIYAIGGYDSGSYQSTVYEGAFAAGVSPSSGPLAGGNTVTISGSGLGNGDVTNVTLCGVRAVILADHSPTQVVVTAGSAVVPTNGDVAVHSVSCGMSVESKTYSYLAPAPVALDATNMTLNSFHANWQGVVGATNYLLDVSTTSDFSSFAGGYTNLSAGNATTYKVDRLLSGTTYYYRVRSEQDGVAGENSATIAVQTLSGAISVSNGPASGSNTLTISGPGLGSGSDITNVTVCGIAAAIQGQSADSVSVVVGAEGSGTGEIRVYSSSRGVTVFANGYTYNPPGYIFGPFMGWSSVSNLPTARGYLAAVSANGKIYAIGGYDGSRNYSTVYVYDPSQPGQGWLSVSNLPAARHGLAAASVNGKIYAIGGHDSSGCQSTIYVYDPSQPTQGWRSVSNLPAARGYLAAASVNGRIYAIGGYDGSYQSTVYVYDPSQTAQGWRSVSNLPAARSDLAAASVNGKIYAIGGYNSGGYQSTVYVYDPSQPAQGWRSVSNLPAARGYLAAASVNGKIYAIGGSGSGGHQSTVYEGAFAAGVSPSSGPPAGGNTVTIGGSGLGNGDVTNVSLCGIAATMVADHSPTQIVVIAGTATVPTNGDVAVYSTSYGTTIKGNAYTYVETVTAPDPPAGSGIGETGSALTFITGASTNTEGYAVEYRFDWGDGSVSDWGSATGAHAFAAAGAFGVKAQARCAIHTNLVSVWSAPASVVVWSSGDVPGLSEDLVAHYSFNFGAMDLTGNGHDGTLTNGASISPAGRYGSALLLDGSNDYVHVAGSQDFAFTNFSFSAWVKPARIPTGFDDYMCVVDDLTPSVAGGGAQLALGNSGFRGGYRDGIHSIAVDVQAGNPYAFSAGDTNEWHLLTYVTAWSNNQAVMRLYKDGQLAAVTTNALAPMAYDGQVLYIGVNCDGRSVGGPYQREYKGLIDDVKIYRRALTPAEVACLFANPAVNEEEISPPDAPSGPADGYAGQVLAFSTTGSVSEAGHAIEYRFDWGDGNMSDWGPGQDTHAWAAPGIFPVKAQARCASDTNALSLWSAATALDIRTPTPGLVRLTASLINIAENAGSVTGWVERTGGADLPASVDYATTANSAKVGTDFIAVTGVLSWADGDAEAKPIVVPIVDDTVFEILERFTLSLSNAAGTAMGSPSSRSVYISDNDPEPVPIIRLSGDLAFGGVGTNTTSVRTLTVHNDGTAALSVSAVTCPDGFTAEPQSLGVPAGGSSPVSVTFAPSAVTTYVGTITVSSDAMSGDGTIPVSGQGQVSSLSFAAWLQQYAPGVDPATGFTQIDPQRGYPYGLLYAFGDNFPSNAVLMQVRLVNGGPVIDIPSQDELTLDGAEVLLQGTTNLLSGDWSWLLTPALDTTGMPPNRRWWIAVGDPLQFFGRIQVQQK